MSKKYLLNKMDIMVTWFGYGAGATFGLWVVQKWTGLQIVVYLGH